MCRLDTGFPATSLIKDSAGYQEVLLAASEVGAGRVLAISDENTVDDLNIGHADNFRLARNMIKWLSSRQYEHDLAVSLKAPSYVEPGSAYLVNATAYNKGMSNETGVELMLLLNDVLFDLISIPLLANGTSYSVSFPFTPLLEATYNLTAYVPPVPNETTTMNNVYTKLVHAQYPLIKPIEGQTADYVIHYYDFGGNPIGDDYWNLTYDHYVEPHLIYVTAHVELSTGEEIEGWMIVNIMNRWVESGMWAGLWYPGWIEKGLSMGSTINLLYGSVAVNDSRIVPVGVYPIDCWGFTDTFGERLWYDKVSGLWIGLDTVSSSGVAELRLVKTNIPIGSTYEHELVATLEAPNSLEPNNSSLLNTTAYNVGLNAENSVVLSLLINGTEVESAVIPVLANGSSYMLGYQWTPTSEATYNITAYVQPVFGEGFSENNIVTKMLRVRTIKGRILFDQSHFANPAALYSIWISDLVNRGYVVNVFGLGLDQITPSVLAGYDVFVIPGAYSEYSSDEIAAIQSFMQNGSGLLAIGSGSPYIYTGVTGFAGMAWDYGGSQASRVTLRLIK